jgi:hypothetical protein
MKPQFKRIATDASGFGLILLGIALGWLPGPGGIPLVLGGLGLLSINNAWARRLRDFVIRHTGNLAKVLFPELLWVQWAYDFIIIILLIIVGVLAQRHAAIWQISLAITLFFIALLVAGLNRDRYGRIKMRVRNPRPKA